MKGLIIKYPMLILIVTVVIIVSIGIMKYFTEQVNDSNGINLPPNAEYLCTQLNDTEIRFEDFQDILYVFLNGKCNNFYAKTKERITSADINRSVNAINPSFKVIQINECNLPTVNTQTVYINFTEIGRERNLYLRRREFDNSDILICGG